MSKWEKVLCRTIPKENMQHNFMLSRNFLAYLRDQIDSLALEQKIKDVIRQEDVALETKKREAQANDTSRSMIPNCNEVVFNFNTLQQTSIVYGVLLS